MSNTCKMFVASVAVCLLTASSANAFILISEDFEAAPPYRMNNGNSHVTITHVADPHPSGSHGTVGAADHGKSTGTWGEVRVIPSDNLALPEIVDSGMDVIFTTDYLIPTDTRFVSSQLPAVARI